MIPQLYLDPALLAAFQAKFRQESQERERREADVRAAFHLAATTGDVLEGEFTDVTDQKLLPPPGDP